MAYFVQAAAKCISEMGNEVKNGVQMKSDHRCYGGGNGAWPGTRSDRAAV